MGPFSSPSCHALAADHCDQACFSQLEFYFNKDPDSHQQEILTAAAQRFLNRIDEAGRSTIQIVRLLLMLL